MSEESLRYYENKEKNGEPVSFLDLSLEEVFSYEPIPKKVFSDEELEENRKGTGRIVKEVMRKRQKNPKKVDSTAKTDEERLSELLAGNPYTQEQLTEILAAVESGMEYSRIIALADIRNSVEKMRELREPYFKTKDTTD